MKTYKATVTREGKWWMVAIPELNGLTQARRLSEARLMAQEWIAVNLDVGVEYVDVDLSVPEVRGVDIAGALSLIQAKRLEAATLEAHAKAATEILARRLADCEIPVRDIGTIMGVSFQRAHQLVNAPGNNKRGDYSLAQ